MSSGYTGREYEFKNFWIRSGLPSSLLEYAKIHTLRPEDYLGTYLKEDVLTAYDIAKRTQDHLQQNIKGTTFCNSLTPILPEIREQNHPD
jgi:hypothetical protein